MNPENPSPEQRNEAEARFLEAAERIGASPDGFDEAMSKEPWPEWQSKLVLRLVRTYAPTLKKDDLDNKPQVFYGYAAAAQFEMAKVLEAANFSAFPESEFLDAAKKMIEGKGGSEIVTESQLFEFARDQREQTVNVKLPLLCNAIAAAAAMPYQSALDFFVAFGDGLNRHVGLNSVERLGDSSTVQICVFIISLRPLIEAGVFKNISELIEFYFFLRDKAGEEHGSNTLARREAFGVQFRKICSEAGLKLAGRGRPRRATATPSPNERPKRSRSRKQGKRI